MNPLVQKYGPPFVVFGAALFWGWPPSEPIDLGEDLVKARAVRWKASDLQQPHATGLTADPFRPVLVAKEEPKAVDVEPAEQFVGPSEEHIRAVVRLTGIASIGGRSWAIVNGKPRLAGDTLRIRDDLVKSCKVMAIHADHILVQCEQTFAVIRPQLSRGATNNAAPASATTTPVKQTNRGVPPPDVGAPPQASIE